MTPEDLDAALARLPTTDLPPMAARAHARAAQRRLARSGTPPTRFERWEPALLVAFATAQLDLALGRSNVVHAALLAGPASNGFLARCQSLERFRTIAPGGRGTG